VSKFATARAPAPSNNTVSQDIAVTEDKVVTMRRLTHTASGLQEALRSSGKGSWKFTLLPLGFGALILVVMIALALSSR